MFLENGQWLCTSCGALIDVDDGAQPVESSRGRSGQPTTHVVTVGDREVHTCQSSSVSAP